jgi:transcriptional regulator with XRE-family HTH domain
MPTVANDGPHPVDRHVGRRIAEKRVSLGYNQSELARALGITFQQVQKYEKGFNRISASKLWTTAEFLQADVGWFFGGLDADVDLRPISPPEGPLTRATVEIARLTPQLTTRQQKIVLDLVRDLTQPDDEAAAKAA